MKRIFISVLTGNIDTSGITAWFNMIKKAALDILSNGGQMLSLILGSVCVLALAFLIFQCVKLKNQGQGDEIPKKLGSIFLVALVMVLLFSFGLTGWGLLK